jgi:hypothetical protein
MTEKDFESYVWVFWSIAGLGILIYGLAYAPLLMLMLAAFAYVVYRLFCGK